MQVTFNEESRVQIRKKRPFTDSVAELLVTVGLVKTMHAARRIVLVLAVIIFAVALFQLLVYLEHAQPKVPGVDFSVPEDPFK